MRHLIALLAVILVGMADARASDVSAVRSIADDASASAICAETCGAFQCAWSGEWRRDGDKALCDCGIARTRMIPGGPIRTAEAAEAACTEICDLNDDTWDGKWAPVPGAYTLCGCRYVSDYCPTDKK
ncbi:hypothetical protein [Magnetospira sp. QH-2]|uniref:hypothetical protein n=1 Tax=Magnetospira sp. (strain QH-2) TaxID=1288970 RepID=UPI0003E80FF8|nr:hypothetical protein [Magnetospira sp. QH-2]CCQ75083.1 conserved exported protein of unknown function [Magnetospira sp. QH-2]